MISVLFRLFKGIRHDEAVKYMRILLFFVSMVLYSTAGFMYFELPENPDLSWGDSFWWTIVTMTTVGYGDFFPESMAGRLFIGFPTMILGVSCLGYVLSLIASMIIESKMEEMKGMKQIVSEAHIVICGFVSADKLMKLIAEIRRDSSTATNELILIDDHLEEIPAEIKAADKTIRFVKGDPCRKDTLERANVEKAQAIIIQANANDPENSDNLNLRTALTLEFIAPTVYTVVECLSPDVEVFFHRAGVDSTVCLSNLTGQMMVQELQDPGIGTIVSELTSNQHGKQFYLIPVPESCASYTDVLNHFERDSGLVLGIRRDMTNHLLPAKTFALEKLDKVVMIASRRPA